MKITNYEKQKNNEEKFNVFVDNKYSFSISINGWVKNNLYVDKEIDEDEIEKIKNKDRQELAFLKVIDIYSYGLKTEKEIIDTLKKKDFNEKEIAYAIDKAKGYNYINDEYYAKTYIESRGIPNKWGRKKIYTMLWQKGISKEIINNTLDLYLKDETNLDNAYSIALKKYKTYNKNKFDNRQCKQKLVTFLLGKGYEYDVVKVVVDKIINCEEYE